MAVFDLITTFEVRYHEPVVPSWGFVRHALVVHANPVAEEEWVPVEVIAFCEAHEIHVGVQSGEVRRAHEEVVGVHDPDVVAVALG